MYSRGRDRDGDSILWNGICFYTIPNSNSTNKDGIISTKTNEVVTTCHFDLTSESLICYDVVSGARAPQKQNNNRR